MGTGQKKKKKVVKMSNWSLCDHFWEENWLEWKHKWERQTSYNKWWYRIQNSQKYPIILLPQSGNKSTCMTSCMPVVWLTRLVGRLSEVFDEEEANQASNTFVQHYRWPDVRQRERWGVMKANYNHLSYHIAITSFSHMWLPGLEQKDSQRQIDKNSCLSRWPH